MSEKMSPEGVSTLAQAMRAQQISALARELLAQLPRCERGQCRHHATWTISNGLFSSTVCDVDEKDFHLEWTRRTELGTAGLVRRAIAALGAEPCSYHDECEAST